MAIVIHTINGKLYAYEHYRVGDKVVSTYLYPVDSIGTPRTKQQIDKRRQVEIKKAVDQLKAFDKPTLTDKQEKKTREKLLKLTKKIEKNRNIKRNKITKFGNAREKFDKTTNILEPEHWLTTKREKEDFIKQRDKYRLHLENSADYHETEQTFWNAFRAKYQSQKHK